MRLGGYEVVLRPVSGGRAVRPVTADTIPPPQPINGRADELRRAARKHTGLNMRKRRALLGDAATAGVGHSTGDPASDEAVSAPGGRQASNFDVLSKSGGLANSRGEGPHEKPHEESQGPSTRAEHPGQTAPLNTPYPHVDDAQEDRWTGTD